MTLLDEQRAVTHAERLRTLIEGSPDPIFFKDPEGRWLEVNHAALDLFGMQEGDYKGETDLELAARDPVHREAHLQCARTDALAWERGMLSRVEEVIPRADGTPRIFDVYKMPLFDEAGARKGLIVLARDITERKYVEQELLASEERLRRIVETTPDCVLLLDASGRVVYANPSTDRAFGEPKTLVGREWSELAARVTLLDGQPVPTDVAGLTRLREVEVTVTRADGSRVVLSVNAAPLAAPASGTVIAARDVTERHALDRMKTEFLKIAAHELRTPLTPLKLLLQETRLDLSEEKPVAPGLLDRLDRQVSRLTHIVNELLDVARLEQAPPHQPQPADLRALAAQVVQELRAQQPGRDLRLVAPDEAARVLADAHAIERAIVNLVDNALKYSRGPVEVRVTLERAQVRFSVRDEGPGIPPEQRAGLFSRFYRVASEVSVHQPGLGLGLFITREIVARHGGQVGVDSEVGRGSTFWFTLPRLQR